MKETKIAPKIEDKENLFKNYGILIFLTNNIP